MKTYARALLILACALSSTGCLSIETIDVRDALQRRGPPAAPPAGGKKIDRELTIYIVSSKALGGVIHETRNPDQAAALGSYNAKLVPFDADDPEAQEAQIEALADSMQGVLCGLRVEGFGEVLRELLERHLKEHFRSVKVELVRKLDSSGGVIVRPKAESYMEIIPAAEKHSLVELHAQEGKRPILATGHGAEHMARGHLIWAVPATFVAAATVGLPGLVVIQLGVHSLEADALEDSLLEGMNDAARRLADKLAAEPEKPIPVDFGKISP
jgi:hypothetical protein